MPRNPARTVYIGNLDDKVNEKVLYEVLIQVGHLVDLYIPRDKETNHHKGYAFAEYETEEIAEYAVRLFSGLVRLHNKTLKFAIEYNHVRILRVLRYARCMFPCAFHAFANILHHSLRFHGRSNMCSTKFLFLLLLFNM